MGDVAADAARWSGGKRGILIARRPTAAKRSWEPQRTRAYQKAIAEKRNKGPGKRRTEARKRGASAGR